MKKLLLLLLVSISFSLTTFSQTTATTSAETATAEDYERMIDNFYTISFRSVAYDNLDLTADEIKALDPIYMEYMRDKAKLVDRRQNLIERYQDEMSEDDRREDEAEESAEFIEDYWEIGIDEQRLRKEYFDRMEDAISYRKAFQFFLLEEAIQGRMNEEKIVEIVPVYIDMTRPELTYRRDINIYNEWMVDVKGEVSLDHDYTYNGLQKLTRALEAAAILSGSEVNNLRERANTIQTKADKMRDNTYADTHADHAREAFLMVVSMVEDIQKDKAITVTDKHLNDLRMAAEKIDPDVLYTDQATHVYSFFDQAQAVVNNIIQQVNWSVSEDTEANSDDK